MSDAKTMKALVLYGYGIEFLLAGLVFVLVWQGGWLDSVYKFADNSAGSWATFFGVMLAGAFAARLVFFGLNTGDFSSWLEWKKLGGVYAGAFLFNVLLFLVATSINVVLVYVKGTWFTVIGVFVSVLALINSVTFPLLVYRLTRLQAVFNFEFKRALEAEKQNK